MKVDGHGTRTKTSNHEGNQVWIDPGAAKVYDVVVDGDDGSLIDSSLRGSW